MRARARRWLRWTARGLVALALVLLLALAFLGLTGPGLRLVLALGLPLYERQIEGGVRVGRAEGRLLGGFTLRDVVLSDRAGRPLVTAEAVAVDWSPLALLRGRLRVDSLRLERPRVHLVGDAAGGFADLAPPGEDVPEDMSTPPGPDLPLAIAAALHLRGGALLDADGAPLVEGVELDADARGLGRAATLAVTHGRARVPGWPELRALELRARWAAPVAAIDWLRLRLPAAELVVPAGRLDVRSLQGAVRAGAAAAGAAVAGLLPPAVGEALRPLGPRLELALAAEGGPEDLAASLELRAGDASATLAATGAWQGEARVDAQLVVDADLGPWTAGEIGRVRPTLTLRAREAGDGAAALTGGLRCAACDGLDGLALAFAGEAAQGGKDLSFETSLSIAGVAAEVDVRASGGRLHALAWRLAAPELRRPARVARRFVAAAPEVRGALRGRGACAGPALRCQAALTLRDVSVGEYEVGRARVDADVHADMSEGTIEISARDLRLAGRRLDRAELALSARAREAEPVETPLGVALPPLRGRVQLAAAGGPDARARLDMSFETGDFVRAELRALELARGRARVALEGPASATLRRRSLSVDDLRLAVAGGRVRVDGVVDLDGPSDLRLTVEAVRLATLRPLLPGPRLSGLVAADAHLRGRPGALALRADLRVRRAGVGGRALGELGAAVRLAGGRATVEAGLRGPPARRIGLRAGLPLQIDLSRGTWSIGDAGAFAALEVQGLRLRWFAGWTGQRLGGRVDGVLRYDGDRVDGPRLTGVWRGRDLSLADVPLGALRLALAHDDGRLQGEAELARAGGRARLEFAVPLTIDPPGKALAWRREAEHRARLRLDDVDLAAQLGDVAPELDVAGRAQGHLALSGPADALALTGALRLARLRVADLSFGTYDLRAATTTTGGTALTLAGGGPVGRVVVDAFAPWSPGLGPREGEGWYGLDVDVRRFELAALHRLAGLDLSGRGDLHLRLVGPARAPRLLGALVLDDVAHAGAPLGALRAELALREGAATVRASGRVGRCGELHLDARAPVDVDLERLAVAWRPAGAGSLHLDVTDLDRSVLDALDVLPPDALLAVDLHARADIDPEHVRGSASLTGEIGRLHVGVAPVALRLEVEDEVQRLRGGLGWRDGAYALALAFDAAAPLPAIRRGEAEFTATTIRGAVTADAVDLRPLGALLPESLHDLAGSLDARVTLAGPLDGPLVRGEAHLRDGAITVVPLQQRFRGVALDALVDGRTLRLERLVARSGEGRVQAAASARWTAQGRILGAAAASFHDFPVVRPGWPQMTVDARARAELDARPDDLELALTVRGAEVWVSDLTTRAPDPIPENEDVTIVRRPLAAVVADEDEPATEPADEPAARDLSIRVELAQPVHLQGPTMDMRWAGTIASVREDGASSVHGQLTADRGRFELLGTEFRIEQGRVFLPEDGVTLDPFLDLVAEARTPQADVTVSLRGRLSRPELHLRSQPPLTEPQIFSLLLTGSVDSNETDARKAQASAAGLLVNFSNPTLARFAESRLGIDRIKVGFGADLSQPVLTVGKYLSRSIYVESTYHHNAPARQNRIEGQVEYRFAPGWSVETFFGDAAVGGLDVFWRHRFGRRRRAPPP